VWNPEGVDSRAGSGEVKNENAAAGANPA